MACVLSVHGSVAGLAYRYIVEAKRSVTDLTGREIAALGNDLHSISTAPASRKDG
jgi:hypothetical protein